MQVSCTVTTQRICIFVFAFAKSKFSHDAALIKITRLIITVASVLLMTVNVFIYFLFLIVLLSKFTWTHVLVIPGETAIKILIGICLMVLPHVPLD